MQKKKSGVKKCLEICAIKGGGGGGRLMANAILNFHFDYLNTSLTFQDFTRPSRIVALTTKNNDGVFNNHSGMIEPSLAEKMIVGGFGEDISKSDILVYNSTSEYNSQSTQIDHFARRYKLSLQARLDHHMPPRCCQSGRVCAGFSLR